MTILLDNSSTDKSNYVIVSNIGELVEKKSKWRVGRAWLSEPEFLQANIQKRSWVKAVIEETKLKGNEQLVIEALAFLTDPVNGEGAPAIGTIAEKVPNLHYDVCLKTLKRLAKKGAIEIVRQGKKLPNKYTLLNFKTKSDTCYCDSHDSLNSSLRVLDPTKEYTYIERDVCILNNLDKEYVEQEAKRYAKPSSKPKEEVPKRVNESTHINKNLLNSADNNIAEDEIRRAARAYEVEEHIDLIFWHMSHDKGINKAPYLSHMLRSLKRGEWDDMEYEKARAADLAAIRRKQQIDSQVKVDKELTKMNAISEEISQEARQRLRARGTEQPKITQREGKDLRDYLSLLEKEKERVKLERYGTS